MSVSGSTLFYDIKDNATLTFDIECYVNFFLVIISDVATDRPIYNFTMYEDRILEGDIPTLLGFIGRYTMVTFNGIKYDLPMISALANDPTTTNRVLKHLSDAIIVDRLQPWQYSRKYNIPIIPCDQIDIIEVAPGTASLKIYGARLGYKKLQELPLPPKAIISPTQVKVLTDYCIVDNSVTRALYLELKPAIDVRIQMSKEHGMDLRSKSDAQIGEAIIIHQAEQLSKMKIPKPKHYPRVYNFEKPDFVYFQSAQLRAFLREVEATPIHLSDKNKLIMPDNLGQIITYGSVRYQFGIGGLHSVDDHGTHYTDDDFEVLQIDVGSYYPNIILNGGFYPPQIGKEVFESVYRGQVNIRNGAKAEYPTCVNELHKADLAVIIAMVKIILNGSYGKLGSHYSKLFAPGMLANVTLTGQLTIMMLIEQLVALGIEVLSVNTDGITVKVRHGTRKAMDEMVDWWCDVTGFTMDYDLFNSIHYRDVNNYFCEYRDGSVKGIGVFAKTSLRISPEWFIVRDACFDFVKGGSVEDTVNGCEDLHQFINLRKVTGGAVKDGVPLGGSVRWYRSLDTGTAIHNSVSGNKVAGSDCGMPCLDYPDEIPIDVDRQWYINKSYQYLSHVGMLGQDKHFYRTRYNTYYASVNSDGNSIDDTAVPREDFFREVGITKFMVKKYAIG